MKSPLLLLTGFCFAAVLALAAPALREIQFKAASQQFEEGDAIVIEQVVATSPGFAVGDTVTVRGRYRLASQGEARLGFFTTARGAGPRVSIRPDQRADIKAGAGAFELAQVVRVEGRLHVSFYPAEGGSSFGGVYIAPVAR